MPVVLVCTVRGVRLGREGGVVLMVTQNRALVGVKLMIGTR